MRKELIQLTRKTVDRFNISSETYYHAVLLFNVIQLKKKSNQHLQYFTIPVKKQTRQWSSDSDSDSECQEKYQPKTQYIKIHHTEMPQYDKIDMTVCLFLVHKLYQTYPLCLSYLLRHLEIEQRFQQYIISLEKEYLVKLGYKIENMLPSHQTLFACKLWDEFIQNISSTCVDIRFGINEIFDNIGKQIKTSHEIKRSKIQPEFKSIQTQKAFKALSHNIQIIVHHKDIYDLYLRKSLSQNHDDIPSMKKIGLAITYATIVQQTNMVFNKKYGINNKQIKYNNQNNTHFIQYVFNDFLESQFGIQLKDLIEQINIIKEILKLTNKKQEKQTTKNTKICSLKMVDQQKSNKFIQFFMRSKNKQNLHEHHYNYHKKNKGNLSISSTKTDKQKDGLQDVNKNTKCYSILNQRSIYRKQKHLQSTIYQSNISQKAQSLIAQDNSIPINQTKIKNTIKSSKRVNSLSNKSSINYKLKTNSIKLNKQSLHLKHRNQSQQQYYKVRPFQNC